MNAKKQSNTEHKTKNIWKFISIKTMVDTCLTIKKKQLQKFVQMYVWY